MRYEQIIGKSVQVISVVAPMDINYVFQLELYYILYRYSPMLHDDIVKLSTTIFPSDATLDSPTDNVAKLLFSQCKAIPLSESAIQRQGCNANSAKLPVFGHLYLGPGSLYSPLIQHAQTIKMKNVRVVMSSNTRENSWKKTLITDTSLLILFMKISNNMSVQSSSLNISLDMIWYTYHDLRKYYLTSQYLLLFA